MNTIVTSREIVDNKKVIVLDSDCQFNIDAIKESIQLVNNFKADYGLLTLWGIELTICPNDTPEDVFNSFKLIMENERRIKTQ